MLSKTIALAYLLVNIKASLRFTELNFTYYSSIRCNTLKKKLLKPGFVSTLGNDNFCNG